MSIKKTLSSKRLGATAVFFAALMFSLVLVYWPRFPAYRQSLFVETAHNGNLRRMNLMLALGADVNGFECPTARCQTPLTAAVQGGQYEAVQLLLPRGADVNKKLKRGQTALMLASYYGHTELVRLLLANGADVNADSEGDTALSWAREKHRAEVIDLLIAAGARK